MAEAKHTPLDLDALEKVAQAADTGPWSRSGVRFKWRTGYSAHLVDSHTVGPEDGRGWVALVPYDPARHAEDLAAADHVATFDPPTVLALIQMQRELVGALKSAAAQFRHYEALHAGKGTPDGDSKAITNRGFANVCEAAITKALGEQPL